MYNFYSLNVLSECLRQEFIDYPMHAECSIRVFTTQIYIGLFDYLCIVVHAERSIRAYLTVNDV